MSSHLTAERVEALASKAEADAHLEACLTCREAVHQARGRQRLLKGLAPYTLGDMAFRRVEARLNESLELGLPPEPFRWRWVLWAAPVALAAIALVMTSSTRTEVEPVPRSVAVVVVKAPWQPMLTTQASGDAQLRPGHEAWSALLAGAVLDENVAVSGSKVVLTAKGWAFEATGSVALGGSATIALGAGTLRAQLDHAPMVVVAGGLRLSGEEGAFFVSRAAAEVVVDVFEGQLEVGDSVERMTVTAPVRVRWVEGNRLRSEALGSPRASIVVPREPLVRFDVSELGQGAVLDVDGQRVGTTPLSLLLGAGRHRVQVTLKGQATRETFVDLVGGQTTLFHLPPAVLATKAVASPDVDEAALARVLEDLKRQTPKLRSCYEKWLKANPTASGEVDLSLRVSASGQVLKAAVTGAPISRESAECLTITARSLVLSPLGSAQDLEVPLLLTPGR